MSWWQKISLTRAFRRRGPRSYESIYILCYKNLTLPLSNVPVRGTLAYRNKVWTSTYKWRKPTPWFTMIFLQAQSLNEMIPLVYKVFFSTATINGSSTPSGRFRGYQVRWVCVRWKWQQLEARRLPYTHASIPRMEFGWLISWTCSANVFGRKHTLESHIYPMPSVELLRRLSTR